MANIALYRKYRPRSFAEVIGQEHVTEPLMAALRNGRLNHAYLFSGPRGCGKTSSARILARSVNCEKGPTPEPCGECESCLALAPGGPGSIDVIEIDAASHGGVDDARELREKAFFAPVNSRFKVYVIDEAHMVSSAGFNALLKLVEEPPEYVLFVFATTEPDKVLGTIRSRTHHYPFRLVPPATLRAHLERNCADEGVWVDPAVFPLVVKAGGGSVRDAQSILDQLLAGADADGVSYQRAVALLGVTDGGLIDAACDALADADGAALFGTVDRVVEAGHDPRRFASDLLERLRDLIVLRQVPDAADKGLVDAPAEELERLTDQARRLGAATLARMADILHEGLAAMRGATSPRLVLEVLCARMLLPGTDSAGDLLQRMERLEQRMAAGTLPAAPASPSPPAAAPPASAAVPSAPTDAASTADRSPASDREARPAAQPSSRADRPTPADAPAAASTTPTGQPAPTPTGQPAPASAPSPSAASADGGVDMAAVERAWPRIVEHTKRRRVVWSLLQNAAPFDLTGDTLMLKARNAGIAGRFNDDSLVAVLQQALHEVLGVRWRVRCQANPSPSAGPRSAGGAPAPSHASEQSGPSASVGEPAPGGPAAPGVPVAGGPARPDAAPPGGGVVSGRSVPSGSPAPPGGPVPPAPSAVDDWPETARPGGTTATAPQPPPGAPSPAAAPSAGGAASAVATAQRPRPANTPAAPATTAPAGAASAGTASMDGVALPDGPTDFSPDDPVPVSLGAYDQFAPGDEPLDEPLDASTPPPEPARSREEQALALFAEQLGAEKLA